MSAYYNEIDPFASEWLKALISKGLIADGEVDTRSITEVEPDDLKRFTQCHFFAGIGGWSYALRAAGWPDDLAVFTGSCPCQGFSASGKRGGFSDQRHLWPAWFRLIRECRPNTIFGEQVASKDSRAWWDVVASDLEGIGYSCGPAVADACLYGAYQRRRRTYFVAMSTSWRWQGGAGTEQQKEREFPIESAKDSQGRVWSRSQWIHGRSGKSYAVEPGTFPLAHGVPNRVGKLRGYGNAIVPQAAQAFIEAYMEIESDT